MNDNENKTNAPTILPVWRPGMDESQIDAETIICPVAVFTNGCGDVGVIRDANGDEPTLEQIADALNFNEADALRAEVEGYHKALQNLVHTVEKSSLIAAVWMGSGRRDAEIEQIVGAKNIAKATLKEYAAIKPNAAAGEEGTE